MNCILSIKRISIVTFILMAFSSCAFPLQTRTAEVLTPGKMRIGGHIGGSFGPSKLPDAILLEYMANWGGTARLGIAPRLEAMVDLGWLKQGIGLRVDMTNADRGEYVSTALVLVGSGGPILTQTPDSTPEYRQYDWAYGGQVTAGIDISAPLWKVVVPLINATLSYGHQWYNIPKSNPNSLHIEESKYQMRSRIETRVETNFGIAINLLREKGTPQIILGVSPYWVVASSKVPGNNDSRPDGVTFTLGANRLVNLWNKD